VSIDKVEKGDYQTLVQVWESSVRATHDFLPDAYIEELKPLILKHYFDAVELRCFKTKGGHIVGFIGVAGANIEMLFVEASFIGRGIGRQLLGFAINHFKANQVDVNEQNPEAISFYERMGFERIGRSERDGQGKPYPLIHMKLNNTSGAGFGKAKA